MYDILKKPKGGSMEEKIWKEIKGMRKRNDITVNTK